MSFRSLWRKASAIVIGASLVGGALLGGGGASAQAPVIPSLAVITGITDASGAAVTSGTVAALIGGTVCVSRPIGPNLALDIGQPNQPAGCVSGAGAAGTDVTFTVNGQPAVDTPDMRTNQGVPQNIALRIQPAATATATPAAAAPRPGATGNGGYQGGGLDSMMALGLGVVALAAVGGGVAIRRVRR